MRAVWRDLRVRNSWRTFCGSCEAIPIRPIRLMLGRAVIFAASS